MAGNIRCIILRKNRSVEVKKVSRDKSYFVTKGKLYIIPIESVNLTSRTNGGVNPTPELIYIENNPIPLSVGAVTKQSDFLDALVVQNFLKTTGKPKGFALELLLDYLHSPGKIILLVFALIILITALMSILRR